MTKPVRSYEWHSQSLRPSPSSRTAATAKDTTDFPTAERIQFPEKPMVPVQLSNVLHSYGSMSKPALHTEITADGDWIKTYMRAQKLLRF
jgi:hypothetical protein